MRDPVGLYVHLPFCRQKCAYCDFPSYAGQEQHKEAYTMAVCGEIRQRAQATGRLNVDTVYLGGGTPSVMEPEQMRQILRQLQESHLILPEAEISCEANPGTLKAEFLQVLREGGVNRLSLGAQSAHAGELAKLGRIHTWEAVEDSFALARSAGFENISMDLMSALPGQTWDDLEETLVKALALGPDHLSCYSLILEEGTPLYAQYERGRLELPDEDAERAMYWNTVRLLEDAGYLQYEISNFARPGRECRHNLNCWHYHDYLGFGASAAGLYRGQRRKNPSDLQGYLQGQAPEVEELGPPDARFEMLMLGLRLNSGLDMNEFEARMGITLEKAWPEALNKHLADGLLEFFKGSLRLTRRGFDLMDRVLLDFLPD